MLTERQEKILKILEKSGSRLASWEELNGKGFIKLSTQRKGTSKSSSTNQEKTKD